MTKGRWYYNGEDDHYDDDDVDDDADDDWPASGVGDEDGGDEEDQRGRQPEIDDAPYGEGEPWTNDEYYLSYSFPLSLTILSSIHPLSIWQRPAGVMNNSYLSDISPTVE